ncbi:hypothetical protein GS429_13005 [Natronorubrum sp. JWXQ-INN-674]|uniref:Uncharacterized protein n=1 Tax=Natronorubrum halalkaliphilum TaxID=2691917 RepID=A0A6B0VR55_9EURY|nr:hypothetical protein [Natronorubrum halalkaliphilum]MXV62969.1 hypothetical protein [Natronorubrum halalkaliphilum]
MSTDSHRVFGRRPAVRDVLEHPLLGLDPRRTAIAVGYLAVLGGLFAVSYAGTAITIDGAALETLTPRFDTVSTVLIALATATIAIVPFLYAAWNGGPVLSFAMPLVPVAFGTLATGQYVLGLDAAIALTVGGAASTLALFATGVRRTGSLRPWRTADLDGTHLLVVTMLAVVAAVSVGRFVAGSPPRNLEWYAPFAALWLVPVAVVGVYWQAAMRTAIATRTERPDSEP